MTNRTNKLVKRLLYDEQKQWHNKNNWSIFQNALLSKGVTTYRYPTNATSELDEKITFLDNIKEPWQKIGQDIDGEAVGDQSGYSVSLSADGTIVAIGAINNDGNDGTNSIRGHVRVYEFKEGTWQQLGGDIDGEAVGDQSGWSVSLSADGSVVAIGAINNGGIFGNDSYSGHVRIYRSNPGKLTEVTDENSPNFGPIGWDRIGEDIDSEAAVDQSGYSVSLSADGTFVAIGAINNNSYSGHVRVYEFKEGSWDQKGTDIDGEAAEDQSGYSVSLSADGSVVAIGAPFNDANDETDNTRGHVRVYEFKEGSWRQKGTDIDGEAAEDWSGFSVSLSADGSVVAIGAPYNDGNDETDSWRGHVRVYEYDGSSWNQKGTDIDGEAPLDESGWSVSLSADGSVVAIGAINNDGESINGLDNRGHVRVYKYLPRKTDADDNGFEGWHKIGLDIDGESEGDESGYSVSLSADGTSVAITAFKNDGNDGTDDSKRGHVRVYRHNVLAGISQVNHFNANPADIAKNIMVSRYGPQWEQVGADIDGESAEYQSGTAVSLSADGSAMVIGSSNATTTNGEKSGMVRAYQYFQNENGIYGWHKKGQDIIGEGANHLSGSAVSISSDGSIMAIGAPNKVLNQEGDGNVKIYRYDENTDSWSQLGSTIIHEVTNDETGASVSLSADGSVVAIGSPKNRGYVRVYKYNGTDTWIKQSPNINGEADGDNCGNSISLSADGSVVAIGALNNDGDNGTNSGHVRVFKYNGTDAWIQQGPNIDGEAQSDLFGVSVSLSADGSIIAIGANHNDGDNGINSGHVRVFKYNGTDAWNQQGENINGESESDRLGTSVSLSADGSIVAIGAILNDGVNGEASGHVRVYQYDPNKTTAQLNNPNLENYGPVGWNRIGQDIDGEAAGDTSGFSVSLSADGSAVAIGAPFNNGSENNSGHVRVYQIAKRNPWVQQGLDINGEGISDKSGSSVSLNGDGSILAIGSPGNNDNNGKADIYLYENGKWNSVLSSYSPVSSRLTGYYVSLSKSGYVLAVSSTGYDSSRGKVDILEKQENGDWGQLGNSIEGESIGDQSGWSVSCVDGRNDNKPLLVAIGAIYNDDNGESSGHVRVYEYDINSPESNDQTSSEYGPEGWKRIGEDIDGDNSQDQNGYSVSLSADGSTLAIGAPWSNTGYVRVFKLEEGVWNQQGGDIQDEFENDLNGWSVSLSGDGSRVAIGATRNDGETGEYLDDRGHVRVYQRDPNSPDDNDQNSSDYGPSGWKRVGKDIDGKTSGDRSGYSVSLSEDGKILAIGASQSGTTYAGYTRIYRCNANDEWVQLGLDIEGEEDDRSSTSVSLSADGKMLAIGSSHSSGSIFDTKTLSGHTRVYKFTGWGLGA